MTQRAQWRFPLGVVAAGLAAALIPQGVGVYYVSVVLTLCMWIALTQSWAILSGMAGYISPFMGFPFTIAAFVVIVMGGLGNLVGGIIAGFLLGFVEIYGVVLTSANARSIILYGVFVGVLLLRPQGLLGGQRIAR